MGAYCIDGLLQRGPRRHIHNCRELVLDHVHRGGYVCPCNRNDEVFSCIGCGASVTLSGPLNEQTSLAKAMEDRLPIADFVFLSRPTQRQLALAVTPKAALRVAMETFALPDGSEPDFPPVVVPEAA